MSEKIEQTAEIVSEFVAQNTIPVEALPDLIKSVYRALEALGQPQESEAEAAPPKATAAQIRKSITDGGLVSFEDGKTYQSLKRNLTTRGMTPADYRAKWGLPHDYPMVAPAYAAKRSELAKAIGLGRKPSEKMNPKAAKRSTGSANPKGRS